MRVTSIRNTAVLSLIAVLASAGCVLDGGTGAPTATADAGAQPPDPPRTPRGHLSRARRFTVLEGGTATVTARRLLGEDAVKTTDIQILGGELQIQAVDGGRLVVHEMTLRFGDIHLPPESVPPDGLDLMDITVSLAGWTADARWSDDDATAEASGQGELILDWSLQSAEGVLPLAPQAIEDVPLELALAPATDGALSATLHAERAGVFFVWTGVIELADLELSLAAVE